MKMKISLSTCDGDCDDSNPDIGNQDEDGDGYFACSVENPDCDDLDSLLNYDDFDGDGLTTCDEVPDCDDSSNTIGTGNPLEAIDESNNVIYTYNEQGQVLTKHVDNDGDGLVNGIGVIDELTTYSYENGKIQSEVREDYYDGVAYEVYTKNMELSQQQR